MDSTEFSNVQIKPSQYVETDNQWRDIPFWDLFGNEKAKKILTDVRVIEGVVYVIDGADVMNLLRMGDSMRVSFKRKQTENTRQEISDLSPVSSEAMPAPEARVLKPATPVVMRQLKDGTRYGTLKNPGKNVFVRILGGDWTSAKDGMVILPGDEVKTALTESSVEVLIEGGKIGHVEIKEGSLFRIAKAEVDAKTGDTTTLLDLAIGKILVKVEALKGNSKFEVKSPTALTGVRGTIFEVTVKEKA
ncbi:MAG: FecR domain-containing protein [Candidatus Omnitrophota bacterium]